MKYSSENICIISIFIVLVVCVKGIMKTLAVDGGAKLMAAQT
jgi:hypothetical protein